MKTYLLLLLLLTSLFANKTDYSIIVQKPFNAALFDITENYDRTLTAVGFSKEYKDNAAVSRSYTDAFEYLSNSSGSFGSQMHLLSVNNKAEIILSAQTKLSRFNKAIAVVKTPSNGYFVGGYTLDGSLLIVKLDAKAHLVFSKMFGTKNYDRMSNLILMSDGGVLAIGSSTTSRSTHDDMFNTGLGNTDIFLTRFSKDGRELWSKKYGTMHDDNGIDAAEAVDGSIVVISTTSYKKNRDVSLMRITENGNRIWLKHYQKVGNNNNTIIPKKIIRLKDNNFVIALTQYNEMRREHIRLIKFDLYQNILIDKEIFTTYPSEINDIKEYSDGRLIAVGYVKDSYNTDGLAIILDSNLVLLNQEHYGEDNYDIFNAVTIMHNSEAAIAGIHTNKHSQERNMWITKLNPDASLVQLSTITSSVYDRLCLLFKKEIDAKKMYIKKDLTITLTQESLYFEVGKSQLTEKQKQFLHSFNTKLIPFLYKNREFIKTLEINGHTSSEWGSTSFTQKYLKNAKLSLQRSYETVSYLFTNATQLQQKFLSSILKGSGYSYAKKIDVDGLEDKKLSRRVTFKVILENR